MRARSISSIVLTLLAASAAFSQQPVNSGIHRVYSPDKAWAIEIALPDFKMSSEGVGDQPDTSYLSASQIKPGKSESGRLYISIEPAQLNGRATLDEFIADLVKSAKKSGDVVKVSEYNHVSIIRHSGESHDVYLSYYPRGSSLSPFPGESVTSNRRDALEAYFLKNDRLIGIVLYGRSLKSQDEKAFYAVLDSVKFLDTASPITSFDNYSKGRAFFITANYGKALGPLVTALELEQRQRQLDLSHWRDLLEMTAISLVNSGDSKQAKKVFEYGAANDPEYPAFYLWLARYYASASDLDKTILCLQKAFAGEEKHRDWTQSSTFQRRDARRRLPDPLTDPAFKVFAKDDKFRTAVKIMTKGRQKDVYDQFP